MLDVPNIDDDVFGVKSEGIGCKFAIHTFYILLVIGIGLIAFVNAHLEIRIAAGSLKAPVLDRCSFDVVNGVAVGRTVSVERRMPERAARGTLDVFVDFFPVYGVDVVLVVVRVADHQMGFGVSGQQLQNLLTVALVRMVVGRSAPERDMAAENDHLVFGHIRQILLEPLELPVVESGRKFLVFALIGLLSVQNIVH